VAFTYCSDQARAAETVDDLGHGVSSYHLDLSDPEAPERVVSLVENEVGPLDILINNAGVMSRGLLAMTSDVAWSRIVEINLSGAFRCCRAVLPGMMRRRRGSIVNVTSLSAFRGVAGQTSYAATKAGMLGMTRALAREVGKRGIRVNAVAPGFVRTDMTADLSESEIDLLRSGECLPEGVDVASVAEAVRFLCSPGASSITGQCVIVDAGASV